MLTDHAATNVGVESGNLEGMNVGGLRVRHSQGSRPKTVWGGMVELAPTTGTMQRAMPSAAVRVRAFSARTMAANHEKAGGGGGGAGELHWG